jgi:hypothetical protein
MEVSTQSQSARRNEKAGKSEPILRPPPNQFDTALEWVDCRCPAVSPIAYVTDSGASADLPEDRPDGPRRHFRQVSAKALLILVAIIDVGTAMLIATGL